MIDLADRVAVLRLENERLLLENWQLRGALGYSVPGSIPNGNFHCGMCDARKNAAVSMPVLGRVRGVDTKEAGT